jgi:hypothetical protein
MPEGRVVKRSPVLSRPEMTTKRLIVIAVLAIAAAGMTLLGATDRKLTELLYVSWIPAVLAAIAFFTAGPKPPEPEPGVWKGEGGAGVQALQQLGSSHAFTAAHLEANRAGRIHADQIHRGVARGMIDVRFGTGMLVLGAILIGVGLATAVFPNAIKNQDFTFELPKKPAAALMVGAFLGGLAGVLPLALGFVARKHGLQVVRLHRLGQAAVAVGPLKKLERRSRRGGSTYYYVIGNLRLWVVSGGWKTMTGGPPYRVYYVPGRFEVLSIEPC